MMRRSCTIVLLPIEVTDSLEMVPFESGRALS